MTLVEEPQEITVQEVLVEPVFVAPVAAETETEPQMAATEAEPLEETITVGPPVLVGEEPDFLGSPWLTLSRRPLAVDPTIAPTNSLQNNEAIGSADSTSTDDPGLAAATGYPLHRWRLAR
jgi:hypothetical protein